MQHHQYVWLHHYRLNGLVTTMTFDVTLKTFLANATHMMNFVPSDTEIHPLSI